MLLEPKTPAGGETGLSLTPTLSWGASTGAESYEYCIATTTSSCSPASSSWINTASTDTSVVVPSLNPGTGYYWHVRAVNTVGTAYSNGSSSFFRYLRTSP